VVEGSDVIGDLEREDHARLVSARKGEDEDGRRRRRDFNQGEWRAQPGLGTALLGCVVWQPAGRGTDARSHTRV